MTWKLASMIVILPFALAACGGGETEPPRAATEQTPAAAPAAEQTTAPAPTGGGTIEVAVTYAGEPVIEKMRINKDTEQCGTEATIPRIAVGPNNGLAHAVVSVAGAEGGPAQLEKAVMDQRGCEFLPRVVATQTGDFEFLNNDGILHNVRTTSKENPQINKAMPKFRTTMTERFDKPEVVRVACDVHSWMLGWVAVFDHPHFGVTDEAGTAQIQNVPAGSHTLELWHEELGRHTREVEVREGEVVKATFELAKR